MKQASKNTTGKSAALNRDAGMALWRQIQCILEQELTNGSFASGERLPTEKQLAERFGVNRHTVRQAMAELVRKELVIVEQGRGAFAYSNKLEYHLARVVKFRENILRQRRVPNEELLKSEVIPAERKTSEALQVRPTAPLVCLRTVGIADEHPLCYTTAFVPHDRFPEFATVYRRTRSITASFRSFGVLEYFRATTRIMSRLPTQDEARVLRVTKQCPVFVVESINKDSYETPIEYSICVWAADKVQFVVDADTTCTPTDVSRAIAG